MLCAGPKPDPGDRVVDAVPGARWIAFAAALVCLGGCPEAIWSPSDPRARADAGVVDAIAVDARDGKDATPADATGYDLALPDTNRRDSARSDSVSPDLGAAPSCEYECANLFYAECSCHPSDPCGWINDGYCDVDSPTESCAVYPEHFDDSLDCNGGVDAGSADARRPDQGQVDATRLGPGAACFQAHECASDFCADGVCCNNACGGLCEVCNAATNLGTCVSQGEERSYYLDEDHDGYGDPATAVTACYPQAGMVTLGGDCHDLADAINPDAAELCDDGLDNDCRDGDRLAPMTLVAHVSIPIALESYHEVQEVALVALPGGGYGLAFEDFDKQFHRTDNRGSGYRSNQNTRYLQLDDSGAPLMAEPIDLQRGGLPVLAVDGEGFVMGTVGSTIRDHWAQGRDYDNWFYLTRFDADGTRLAESPNLMYFGGVSSRPRPVVAKSGGGYAMVDNRYLRLFDVALRELRDHQLELPGDAARVAPLWSGYALAHLDDDGAAHINTFDFGGGGQRVAHDLFGVAEDAARGVSTWDLAWDLVAAGDQLTLFAKVGPREFHVDTLGLNLEVAHSNTFTTHYLVSRAEPAWTGQEIGVAVSHFEEEQNYVIKIWRYTADATPLGQAVLVDASPNGGPVHLALAGRDRSYLLAYGQYDRIEVVAFHFDACH